MKALAPAEPQDRVQERDEACAQANTQTHDTLEAALKFAADWSRYRLACAGGGLAAR